MRQIINKKSYMLGIILTLLSYLFIMIGYAFLLKSSLNPSKFLMFFCISLLIGGIGFLLSFFRFKIAILLYLAGNMVGLINMYTIFLNDFNGWSDLIGIFAFFTWILIGLFTGLVIELILYIYKKWTTID